MERDQLIRNYDELYDPERPHTRHATDLLVERVIAPRLRGRSFAELGISTGVFSVRIAQFADRLVLVDGNPAYCGLVAQRLRERPVATEVHCTFFEDFDFGLIADATDVFLISMLHVLPGRWSKLLSRLADTLRPGSRIHVTMSNRLAPNRLLGFHMGLLPSLDDADVQAQAFDTQYVDLPELEDFVRAHVRLTIAHVEGFLCRPVPLAVLDTFIDRAGVELLWRMGLALPPAFCNTTYLCLEVGA